MSEVVATVPHEAVDSKDQTKVSHSEFLKKRISRRKKICQTSHAEASGISKFGGSSKFGANA